MSRLRLIPVLSGASHDITKDEATVGRDPTSDIVVADGSVSRRHARLVRRGNDWAVVDQGSANGTFLDSQRVADAVFRPGQELRFGAVAFRVEGDQPTEDMTAVEAEDVLEPTTFAPPPPPVAAPPPPPPPPAVVAPPPLPAAPPRSATPARPPWDTAPPMLPSRPQRSSAPVPQIGPEPLRKGKGPLFWAALGCGGCLTMVILFVAVLAGGAFYFMKGPVDAVQAQLAEIRSGDLGKAYARFSEGYRARSSPEEFALFVVEHPALKDYAEARFWPPSGTVRILNDRASLKGTIVSTSGAREEALYELAREGGEWKISALRLEAAR